MCDGRSVEELKELAPGHLGFEVTVEQVRSTIEYLADLGLLEATKSNSDYRRVVDASALVARLAPLVRVLISSWFAFVTVLALVVCILLLIADWSRFIDRVAEAARDYPIPSVLLYYLTFIPIALLHELGHAVVVGYYGGEVPEIVIRKNAHFAVLCNSTVLKERKQLLSYLLMGTVVDVYIWLALLVAFHFNSHYLLLMFLLPQTVYFLLHSYSIFNNSDYLKVIATWLDQPTPVHPWDFLRRGWRQGPQSKPERQLLYIMTASVIIKLLMSAFLIWTFVRKEYRVLILYAIYKGLIYVISHSQRCVSRFTQWPTRIAKAGVTD
ncbi:MAG TPA: hypothetical protein VJ124_11910 [Pyrinomonadaceae bacterium]|nr:hypothetical protein [Pyrinomonadaceae bacterium]